MQSYNKIMTAVVTRRPSSISAFQFSTGRRIIIIIIKKEHV